MNNQINIQIYFGNVQFVIILTIMKVLYKDKKYKILKSKDTFQDGDKIKFEFKKKVFWFKYKTEYIVEVRIDHNKKPKHLTMPLLPSMRVPESFSYVKYVFYVASKEHYFHHIDYLFDHLVKRTELKHLNYSTLNRKNKLDKVLD